MAYAYSRQYRPEYQELYEVDPPPFRAHRAKRTRRKTIPVFARLQSKVLLRLRAAGGRWIYLNQSELAACIGASRGHVNRLWPKLMAALVEKGYAVKTAHTESRQVNGTRSLNTKPVYMAGHESWLLFDKLPLCFSESGAKRHIRPVQPPEDVDRIESTVEIETSLLNGRTVLQEPTSHCHNSSPLVYPLVSSAKEQQSKLTVVTGPASRSSQSRPSAAKKIDRLCGWLCNRLREETPYLAVQQLPWDRQAVYSTVHRLLRAGYRKGDIQELFIAEYSSCAAMVRSFKPVGLTSKFVCARLAKKITTVTHTGKDRKSRMSLFYLERQLHDRPSWQTQAEDIIRHSVAKIPSLPFLKHLVATAPELPAFWVWIHSHLSKTQILVLDWVRFNPAEAIPKFRFDFEYRRFVEACFQNGPLGKN